MQLTENKSVIDGLFNDSDRGEMIDLYYMDLVEIHEFSDLGKQFIENLA